MQRETRSFVREDGETVYYIQDAIKVRYRVLVEFVDQDGREMQSSLQLWPEGSVKDAPATEEAWARCQIGDFIARQFASCRGFWSGRTPKEIVDAA